MENLLSLGVPILKHIRVGSNSAVELFPHWNDTKYLTQSCELEWLYRDNLSSPLFA